MPLPLRLLLHYRHILPTLHHLPPYQYPLPCGWLQAPPNIATAAVTRPRKIDELFFLIQYLNLWRDHGANRKFAVYLGTLSNQRICIMSKIKWGAIVVDGRGKLGGHVFTKTRSGATMRTKVTPVNPQTAAQAAARSRLGSQSQAWRGLTEAQRIGWNDLAQRTAKTNIFGDQYFPTGKNLFTGLNSNRMLITQSPLTTAPELVEMPVITEMSPVFSLVDLEITLNIATVGDPTDAALVIEATAPMSAGRFNFDGSYRIIDPTADASAPEAVYLAYVNKFGTPPAGGKIGFRAYYISEDTGQQSPRFAAATIVAE